MKTRRSIRPGVTASNAKGCGREAVDKIAGELLANDLIQQRKIFSKDAWDPATGVGMITPRVILDHHPTVSDIPIDSDATLMRLSDERNLALNPNDIPTIRAYFLEDGNSERACCKGPSQPHGPGAGIHFPGPQRSLQSQHLPGPVSVQRSFHWPRQTWSTAFSKHASKHRHFSSRPRNPGWYRCSGTMPVPEDSTTTHHYVITGETHNSPSNMEAYGGAITGIVGIYRDPMGTGKGSKLIMGSYGFCVGPRNYDGDLKPRLHPRRLLDGVIEGVRDGGNKSGIPTTYGQVMFHPGYIGKCLVFVTALGIMPALGAGRTLP